MAMSFSAAFEQWAYGIGPSHHDRHGRTAGCAERLIGSIRRDCLDHVIVFSEQHLRRLLKSYQEYYDDTRTHL